MRRSDSELEPLVVSTESKVPWSTMVEKRALMTLAVSPATQEGLPSGQPRDLAPGNSEQSEKLGFHSCNIEIAPLPDC